MLTPNAVVRPLVVGKIRDMAAGRSPEIRCDAGSAPGARSVCLSSGVFVWHITFIDGYMTGTFSGGDKEKM